MKGILIIFLLILAVSFIGTLAQEDDVALTPAPQFIGGTQPEAVASAAFVEVDRGDDSPEMFPCTDVANDCSLRSAINIANTDRAATTITFADHYIITLAQPLPPLTENDTIIRARPEQEVHVNGNSIGQSVFYITGAKVTLEGLRVYGAGAGFSNLSIGGGA